MNKSLRLLLALSLSTTAAACVSIEDDGTADCADPQLVYPDADGDGFGDGTKGEESCEAEVPAGFTAFSGDCRDDMAGVKPGAKEVCDAIDNNCDGKLDDADAGLDMTSTDRFYRDSDGDGFGNPDETKSIRACAAPAGYAETWTDCDDAKSAVNPSAKEVCDYIDNDCDGKYDVTDTSLDTSTAKKYYYDGDNDSVGAGTMKLACEKPWGWVETNNDCNDGDNLTFPGGTEICDGADNDCDGGIDGTQALPNRCTGLVGTYTGSYSHLTQEKVGSTVVNSMSCTGNGSAALALNRRPGLQGTFTCTYSGGMTMFSQNQRVTLRANVGLNGAVTGTVDHEYNGTSLKRTYNVTGTQTASGLSLTGTGSWYPTQWSTVPWVVSFNFSTSR